MNILHEQEIWDHETYWELDKALFEIAEKYRDVQMPRSLVLAIYDLYEYTSGRLCWHRMPSDGSTIENLTDDDCAQHEERLRQVVRAALSGYTLANSGFDLTNPLL